MSEAARERIAILGGGIGGLATAWAMSDPAHADRFDVTVYQMGWKLGGLGASGRNRDDHDRIEEHGLHVWFRSYVNAIAMMHRVYEEYASLPAGQRSAFRSFDDAFHAQSRFVFQEYYEGRFRSLAVSLPELPGPSPKTPWDELIQLLNHLLRLSERMPGAGAPVDPERVGHPHVRRFLEHALERLEAPGFETAGHGPHALLEKLHEHMTRLGPPSDHTVSQHHFLAGVLRLADNLAWLAVWPFVRQHFEIRMLWRAFHLGVSCIVGILQDGLLLHGYSVIDDQEYMVWARKHSPLWSIWGALKEEADGLAFEDSPFVKPFYDVAFAYTGGDTKRPSIAAGIGLRSCLRLLLQGSGPLTQEMQAGMGDTIFAPLYEILKARGVRFEFFQRVESVEPSADGRCVAAIHLSQQVRFRQEYEPLFWVKDVQCWPSEPCFEYLDEDPARLRGHDLGHYDSGWTDTGPKRTLLAGEHFDKVVLAIALPCLPTVCPGLIALRPEWQRMVEGISSCRTIAAQLWFGCDRQRLGVSGGPALTGSFVEPLSSLADFTHLVGRESWPPEAAPGYLAYLCGCMPDGSITEREATEQAKEQTRRLLSNDARPIWPRAVKADGSFDWSLLYARPEAEGEARLGAQYFRANIDPTELYVQSAPGSTRYRLRADASGFDNLVLAGTWIDTGINVSCVETAVVSGLQAARAIRGDDAAIEREGDFS